MATEIDLHQLVCELTGPIGPVGCSSTDGYRLENLGQRIALLENLTTDLARIAHNANRVEASMKEIGQRAQCALQTLNEETAEWRHAE